MSDMIQFSTDSAIGNSGGFDVAQVPVSFHFGNKAGPTGFRQSSMHAVPQASPSESGIPAGFFVIIAGFAKKHYSEVESGEMDEWFKSHAWKACVGS